jgi:uncharacterized protein
MSTEIDSSAITPDGTHDIAATTLVDTDVHEGIASLGLLSDYLSPHWQRYLNGGWMGPPATPYAPQVPNKAGSRLEWELEDGTAGTSIEAMRKQLFEGEGVSIAILNGFFHVGSMRVQDEFAVALASAYNDWQIENWLDRDDRLRGSVHVAAQDPQAAVREIDRVATHPQIVQVFLPTVTDRGYGHPSFFPIYEAAVRNDLAVTFHHCSATETVLGMPHHYIEWHTAAAPQAAQGQIISMIMGGVFDKFPELMAIFLETGVAWVPWLMWRMDHNHREARSEVPWVKRTPSAHMRDHVRIATQPLADITAGQFKQLVEMSESERMFVFATDYPHYDSDSASAALPGTLPEDLRQRVRYKNAFESFPRLR